MKWLLLTLFGSLFLLQSGYSQERPKHFSIIENFIKNKQDTARIYYVDSVLTIGQYEYLKDQLEKKKLRRIMSLRYTVTLELTAKEVRYLLAELKKLIGKVWDNALFPNSQKIEERQMFAYLVPFIKRQIELKQKKYTYVWSFSKPISIRNNSLVLVFTQYICHSSCGENEWTFYKKEADGWKRWLMVTGAVF